MDETTTLQIGQQEPPRRARHVMVRLTGNFAYVSLTYIFVGRCDGAGSRCSCTADVQLKRSLEVVGRAQTRKRPASLESLITLETGRE